MNEPNFALAARERRRDRRERLAGRFMAAMDLAPEDGSTGYDAAAARALAMADALILAVDRTTPA